MKTSRQRLLQYLEKKEVATTRDISQTLKMTPANARHHLSILIDQGSVKVVGKLVSQGRGRPHTLYKATKPFLKNNFSDLSRILFKELLAGKNIHEQEHHLNRIAHKLIKDGIPVSNQQYKRLNDTIHQLNQMNYNARWEAHHEAPHIILENCPYIEIVSDVPEICRLTKYLLEQMLGDKVSQIIKLESTKSGFHKCAFIIDSD